MLVFSGMMLVGWTLKDNGRILREIKKDGQQDRPLHGSFVKTQNEIFNCILQDIDPYNYHEILPARQQHDPGVNDPT
jgi:hypothetical protein